MVEKFNFTIPISNSTDQTFSLPVGEVLYLLGANGTGKSSLVSRLISTNRDRSKLISEHRQMTFGSNALSMTPLSREQFESSKVGQDSQIQARYQLWAGEQRASAAIFDLIDRDTSLSRKIADLVRLNKISEAVAEGSLQPPLHAINELMRLSNIPIEISVEDGQKIIARKNGGVGYSIAELSDGERNAFLLAAEVLTAKPNTLLLIDEPERHLHRAIILPLLKLLFDRRKDCAFVISTHEIMLPVDTPNSSTLLVRACEYEGSQVKAWTTDLLGPGVLIDEDLKRDLLGSRRKIIFVEGRSDSLDTPLYSLLFPMVSIVPKGSCRDVEQAVRGLRDSTGMHWLQTWGIIDNDQRSPEDIARLLSMGVWALEHYSIESLYFHPVIIARIASRVESITGLDGNQSAGNAIAKAIAAAALQKEHLLSSAVLRSSRLIIQKKLPNKADITSGGVLKVEVDLGALQAAEETKFDGLISSSDWNGLLTHYPLRESSAFNRIVEELKLTDSATYKAAVLKLLQDDTEAVSELRNMLGTLPSEVLGQIPTPS